MPRELRLAYWWKVVDWVDVVDIFSWVFDDHQVVGFECYFAQRVFYVVEVDPEVLLRGESGDLYARAQAVEIPIF